MKYEVYQDTGGAWRWRLKTRNGRIVADSSESYTRPAGAARAARRVWELNQSFGFEVSDG